MSDLFSQFWVSISDWISQFWVSISDWISRFWVLISDLFYQIFDSGFFNHIILASIGTFTLGLILYKKKKRSENKATLRLFIARLSALLNRLYGLKEQIVLPRYKEALLCEKTFREGKQPELPIEYMVEYPYSGDFNLPIAQERPEFLATTDPNFIVLLDRIDDSIKVINDIIINFNKEVRRCRENKEQSNVNMIIGQHILLFEQLDRALYLTDLLVKVLLKFGDIAYREEMKNKAIEQMLEKYEDIRPKSIEDNEGWKYYEWFPKKKKWWHRK